MIPQVMQAPPQGFYQPAYQPQQQVVAPQMQYAPPQQHAWAPQQQQAQPVKNPSQLVSPQEEEHAEKLFGDTKDKGKIETASGNHVVPAIEGGASEPLKTDVKKPKKRREHKQSARSVRREMRR